jgi:hypothetical protein
MKKFGQSGCFLCLLLCPCVFGTDKPEEANPEIQRALDRSDIRYSKTPPFRISATITLTGDDKGPFQGKYVFMKNADGHWRESLTLPGYNRLRVGDDHNYWQVRNAEYDPLPIQNIDSLVDFTKQLNRSKKLKFSKLEKIKLDGVELSCQHPKDEFNRTESICFDPSNGELAYTDNGSSSVLSPGKLSSMKFSEYQEIAGKRFPTDLKGFKGKNLAVNLHVDELKDAPDIESALFTAPQGAVQWLYCAIPAGLKVKHRVQPVYPQSSKDRREQGDVIFYGVIGGDGKISKLFLIQSVSPDLDKSSATAVSQWVYEQPMCEGVPAPIETAIEVIFHMPQ